MNKYKLHIPTEQYGFIEVEMETSQTGEILKTSEVIQMYHEVKDAYQNPDRKTTCIKCREPIDVKEEAKKLYGK